MESRKIVNAVKWTSIQYAIDTLFRFSVRLVLAKLLMPKEFGLVGMATVFIAVATAASELGMGAALIQRKDNDEAEALYPTAFWSGIGWGIIVYLLMGLIVGPFTAYFYQEPKLLTLIPVLSLGILFKPLSLIHTVILTRSLDFKRLAKVFNIAAVIAGVIALIMAYFNFGVWALAVNNVLSIVLTIPFLFITTKWKPVWSWNKAHFKQIFGFGVFSTSTGIFSTLTYNIDNLMIGKLLGAAFLGSYTLAFSLTEQFRQTISNILNKVMYPVFGKAQNDKLMLRTYFLKIININAIVIYPVMAYMFLFAKDIIIGFFGEKWALAIVPLQLLSIAMMIHLLVNSFTSLIRGIGKPKLEMKIIMGLTLFILLPGLYLGIIYFGLLGAAYAILLNKVALATTGILVLKREIDLPVIKVFAAVRTPIIGIVTASIAVYSLKYFFNLNILILSPIYAAIYAGIIYKVEKQNITSILKSAF